MSETLIALVIIGIVAAITLPIIIANHEEKQMNAALRKNYSVLKSALERYYIDNGEWLTNESDNALHDNFKTTLEKYLVVMKDCGYGGSDSTACIKHAEIDIYKNYAGNGNIDATKFDDGQFVLNDGTLVLIENHVSNKESRNIYISVDVNGYGKKPNRLGRDLFMFQLMKDGQLLPMGTPGTAYANKNSYCSATSSNAMNGAACTYYALKNK